MHKIALITGGSKGIGKALAEEFAKNGYSLILVARDLSLLQSVRDELQTKYKVEIKVLSADLEKPEAIDLIFDTYKDELSNIDVLINNAGFGIAEKFADVSDKEIDGMLKVNMVTLTNLTHRILPIMLAKKSGKILNVASTAAFTPGPYYSIYYATKAYVLSFSVSLAEECKQDGVTVSVLCPGATDSEFHQRAHAAQKNIKLLKFMKKTTVEAVARDGYNGLMNNKRIIITGLMNKVSVWMMNLTPLVLRAKVTGWINRP